MLYIEPQSRDAAYHFAVEEYCMQHLVHREPVFMIWQTDSCAMLGTNQIANAEIDLRKAKELGVSIVRRSSGGGTIFTDAGTFLYTVILPCDEQTDVRQIINTKVAEPVLRVLNGMGIPAALQGRNDILVDGRKVSGLAQYIRYGCLCSHGSLLFDADLEALTQVLRVDEEKIRSKSLQSMRSRVTNIREHMSRPCSVQEFQTRLREELFRILPLQEYCLTEREHAAIEEIRMGKYSNPDWTYGKTPDFSFYNQKRFPEGKIEIFLEVEKGQIRAGSIKGDFLGLMPVTELEEKLINTPCLPEAVGEVLDSINLNRYLGGITKEQVLCCMFE